MTRLFVSAEIPASVREHLAERVQRLHPQLSGWRWGRPDLWHLTLAFFGEVDERRVHEVETRLSRAVGRHPSLSLMVGELGAFGSARRASVLWADIDGDRDALRGLAASVAAAGRRSGIDVPARQYRPHLTLARRRKPVDVAELLTAQPSYQGPAFTVAHVVLVESRLGAQVEHLERSRFQLIPTA